MYDGCGKWMWVKRRRKDERAERKEKRIIIKGMDPTEVKRPRDECLASQG